MAVTKIGKAKSFATTTPASISITDIEEMTCTGITWDKNERQKASGVDKSITLGDRNLEITVKTADIAALDSFCDGMLVEGVTALWEAPATSANADGTVEQEAGSIGWTCSSMMVDGPVQVTATADKKVNIFELKLRSCDEADGTAPVIAKVTNAGA